MGTAGWMSKNLFIRGKRRGSGLLPYFLIHLTFGTRQLHISTAI